MNEQAVSAKTETSDVLVLDTAENSLGKEVSLIEQEAEALVVNNDEDFKNASDLARSVKTMQKKVTEYWEPMRTSTKKAYDDVLAHKKEMLDPLKSAEDILKCKIAEYTERLQEEQKAREEELKRLAQEESDRKLAEAIECQKNGDSAGYDAAMAEAEVMDGMAVRDITVATAKPKAEGVSMSKTWKIVAIDEKMVPTNFFGAVIRPVDQSAVMALIKASKGKIQIPGIVYEETVSVSVRSK